MKLAWLIALVACGGAPPPGSPPGAPPVPRPTGAVALRDATIAVPAGWTAAAGADRVTLEEPDRALRVTVVATAGDARAAIAAAWGPAFALPIDDEDAPPPSGGWDATATIGYAAPAGRRAWAVWRRLGARAYVVLVDGDRDAASRREAQIETIIGSVRPAGLREEQLAGPVRALDAAALDAFARRAMTALEVPGAAIAVIAGGRVVYQRTFGVRALGEPAPITPDTRFLIASVTKPLTTLMQAALVDAGTLRWDTPVTALLPGFTLRDAETTRALRLWHMSCACTGMPRDDMRGLFQWEGVTPEARIAELAAVAPTTKLGETFQYSNPMVAAGGYAAARAFAPDLPLAEAYAAAMQAKVFAPIGMTATTLDFAAVARGPHARPHALALDGTTRAMPLAIERAVEPIAPAGGVWTTLGDLVRYAQTELAGGVAPDGTRVASAAALRERLTLRVRSDDAGGYGLGIGVGTYHGQRELAHDGGSFGFGTTLFLLPDARVGIVILTNVRNGSAKEQLPFNAAMKRRIVEALFGARPLAEQGLAYYAKLRAAAARVAASASASASPGPSSGVAELAGTYAHAALGTIEVRATPAGAELDAGEWRSAIRREIAPDGSPVLVLLDPPFAGGALVIGPGPTLSVPGQTTYTFTRL